MTSLAGGGALQFAFEVDDVAAGFADVRRRGLLVRDPEAGSIRYPSGNTVASETAWVDEGPGWRVLLHLRGSLADSVFKTLRRAATMASLSSVLPTMAR